jgi:hypothetical protein
VVIVPALALRAVVVILVAAVRAAAQVHHALVTAAVGGHHLRRVWQEEQPQPRPMPKLPQSLPLQSWSPQPLKSSSSQQPQGLRPQQNLSPQQSWLPPHLQHDYQRSSRQGLRKAVRQATHS